ncbi:hypothetical protein O9929_23165 [Vibrio lentus]|nr:hypothetical protein [Vibrio lentus]
MFFFCSLLTNYEWKKDIERAQRKCLFTTLAAAVKARLGRHVERRWSRSLYLRPLMKC